MLSCRYFFQISVLVVTPLRCGDIFNANFFLGEHLVKSNNFWQNDSKCKTGTVNRTEYRTFIRPLGLREAHKIYTRYILCYGHVFVRPPVWLGAEEPRDVKSCRRTSVATSSYMRPIATNVAWLVQQSSVTISTKCSFTRHGLDHFCNRVNLYYVIIGCNIDVFSTSVHHIWMLHALHYLYEVRLWYTGSFEFFQEP